MFISTAQHHDTHAELRAAAARDRAALALIRSRRYRRWADRTARLAAALDRLARARRTAAV